MGLSTFDAENEKTAPLHKIESSRTIDVGGIAREYVDRCINDAINDDKSIYIFQGIAALAADVYGGGGGSFTAANLVAYVDHVKTEAISCLTSSARIQSYLQEYLEAKFDATVQNESHWIYWNL